MVKLIGRSHNTVCARLSALALLVAALTLAPSKQSANVSSQEPKTPPAAERKDKEEGKVPGPKEIEKEKKRQEKAKGTANPYSPGEVIAEFTILAYGGRPALETARSAIQEQGSIRLATDQGDITGQYILRSIRKEKSWLDLLRVDLDLTPPEAAQRQGASESLKYTVAFNGASVWSAQNNQYANPKPEAEAAFRAQLTREYTALLRYKEDGSKVELVGPETVVGLDTNVLDLTLPSGEKTRYWVSSKTYRILHIEYELKVGDAQPTKYRISYFYTPLKVIQNTLVPVRRVMMQDGKFVQEITLNNINYSAKLESEIFQHLQGQ